MESSTRFDLSDLRPTLPSIHSLRLPGLAPRRMEAPRSYPKKGEVRGWTAPSAPLDPSRFLRRRRISTTSSSSSISSSYLDLGLKPLTNLPTPEGLPARNMTLSPCSMEEADAIVIVVPCPENPSKRARTLMAVGPTMESLRRAYQHNRIDKRYRFYPYRMLVRNPKKGTPSAPNVPQVEAPKAEVSQAGTAEAGKV